jgi:TldD protein
MLRGVKRGIYAKTFGGGQVDISNGDFVFLADRKLLDRGREN